MSLKVWLPLNGSIINKGVSMFQPPSENITYANIGKIGASSWSGGTITAPADVSSQIFNNEQMSIAFWIYPHSNGHGQIFGSSTPARYFAIFQYRNGQGGEADATSLHLSWDGATSRFSSVEEGVMPKGQWTHVCVTYDKQDKIRIYINGVEIKSYNSPKLNIPSFEYDIPLLYNSSLRYINDLRIYNHCLTKKEVKEISRALVLHYNFNDPSNVDGAGAKGAILDNSGYDNNATLTIPSDYSFVTTYSKKGSRALKTIAGNPAARIDTSLNPSFINGQGTICLWYKRDPSAVNYNSGGFLVCTPIQSSSGKYFGAMNTSNVWHNGASHSVLYIDGEPTNYGTSGSDTNWHFYVFTGVNLNSWSTLSLHGHGDNAWLYRGYIGEFRMYNTVLTQDEIKILYNSAQMIDKKGNEFVSEIEECNSGSKITRSGVHQANYFSEIIQLDDGSYWVQLSHHQCDEGKLLFPSNVDFSKNFVYNSNNSGDCWAAFHLINHLPRHKEAGETESSAKYEFMAFETINKTDNFKIYRWTQTISPMNATYSNMAPGSGNYQYNTKYSIPNGNGGMYRYSNTNPNKVNYTFLCITNSESSNWYGAFGCQKLHVNGVPSFEGRSTGGTLNLYMRIDRDKLTYREFGGGILLPTSINEI